MDVLLTSKKNFRNFVCVIKKCKSAFVCGVFDNSTGMYARYVCMCAQNQSDIGMFVLSVCEKDIDMCILM